MERETLKRTRRTSAEIKKLLEAFTQSRMSTKDFCALHNFSQAVFYKWRSRHSAAPAAHHNFVQLQPSPELQNEPALFAELRGIKIYQPVTAAYLKQLLA